VSSHVQPELPIDPPSKRHRPLICEWCKLDIDDMVSWHGHRFCSMDCKLEALSHYDAEDRDSPTDV